MATLLQIFGAFVLILAITFLVGASLSPLIAKLRHVEGEGITCAWMFHTIVIPLTAGYAMNLFMSKLAQPTWPATVIVVIWMVVVGYRMWKQEK